MIALTNIEVTPATDIDGKRGYYLETKINEFTSLSYCPFNDGLTIYVKKDGENDYKPYINTKEVSQIELFRHKEDIKQLTDFLNASERLNK